LADEVLALNAHVGEELCKGDARTVGEVEVDGLGEPVAIRPLKLRRGPQDIADLIDLIDFVLPRSKRFESVKFCHNAAHRELIDGGVVARRPQQDFRSTVPSRADIISKGRLAPDLPR